MPFRANPWFSCNAAIAGIVMLAIVARPAHAQTFHAVTVEPFVIITDFPFPQAPQVRDHLVSLGERLHAELGLKPVRETVKIYLLKSPERYQKLLLAVMPQLQVGDTQRHGVFLRRRGEMPAMFVLWSDRVGTVLRHEFTHATLSANVANPSIWLDEGIASYYEAESLAAANLYRETLEPRLAASSAWTPDLARLERLRQMPEMGPMEYAESWSWIRFLLSGPPEVRDLLPKYLAQAASDNNPRPLSASLSQIYSSPATPLSDQWRHHFTASSEPSKRSNNSK